MPYYRYGYFGRRAWVRSRRTANRRYGGSRFSRFRRGTRAINNGRSRRMFTAIRAPTAGFPDTAFVKMKYNSIVSPPQGAFSKWIFTDNCYDPDFTGGGHQPRTFDEWTNMYNRYTPLGLKVTATFTNLMSSATPMTVGMCFTTEPGAISSLADISETRYSKTVVLGGPNQGSCTKTISMYISKRKLWGTLFDAANPAFSSAPSGGPTNLIYCVMGGIAFNGGTTAMWTANVNLTIYCRFSQPGEVSYSYTNVGHPDNTGSPGETPDAALPGDDPADFGP